MAVQRNGQKSYHHDTDAASCQIRLSRKSASVRIFLFGALTEDWRITIERTHVLSKKSFCNTFIWASGHGVTQITFEEAVHIIFKKYAEPLLCQRYDPQDAVS